MRIANGYGKQVFQNPIRQVIAFCEMAQSLCSLGDLMTIANIKYLLKSSIQQQMLAL